MPVFSALPANGDRRGHDGAGRGRGFARRVFRLGVSRRMLAQSHFYADVVSGRGALSRAVLKPKAYIFDYSFARVAGALRRACM